MLPMSPETISVADREEMERLRNLLLTRHKLLLDGERRRYEELHGPVGGPGQLLTLVLGDPHFGWLKQFSTLVVEIDEALSRRSKAGQSLADALIDRARETLNRNEDVERET